MHAFDFKTLAIICVVLCVIWLVLLFSLSDPRIFKNIYLSPEASLNLELLNSLKGVVGLLQKWEKSSDQIWLSPNKRGGLKRELEVLIYDVIIVGAGASGLFLGANLKGKKVAILEKTVALAKRS